MKFLLVAINSKYTHTNLAIRSLRANAGIHKNDVILREYTINQLTDDILRDIYLASPDGIAFSCYLWNISEVLTICEELHKLLPALPIWLGGPEATYNAEQLLAEHPILTGIMLGEGEVTFAELLSHYTQNTPALADIDGLLYRATDGTAETASAALCKTAPRTPLVMDTLCFPYEENEDLSHRILYYESSRGCPFSCSYCLSSADCSLRFKSLPKVYAELQYFLDHDFLQVKFVDRTFNCRRAHTLGILQYIKEHDNGITNFHFEIAADLLTSEMQALLCSLRPGQVQLEIGVQTTNEATLRAIRRPSDFDKLRDCTKRLLAAHNLHLHLDLIAGLPKENFASFLHSFDDVYSLKPHQLQLGFLKVLAGTAIASDKENYGICHRALPPYEVLYTQDISYNELCRLKSMERVLELYYNSAAFTASLPFLEKFFASPSALYLTLGAFYDKHSHGGIQHSRITRYQLLLDFASGFLSEKELSFLRELLTYDIYLREDMKSRPSFAPDIALAKPFLQAYRKAEQIKKTEHLEAFRFDILHWLKSGQVTEAPCHICFSYETRDPLTGNASVRRLPTDTCPIDAK